MEEPLLKVSEVSKKFSKSLRTDMRLGLKDMAQGLIGRTSPELRTSEFWAVDEVSLELRRGEVLGILGKNGAGKTTLMRLICGIYPCTKGSIQVQGRIASLFALSAGMHPHFSGRQNALIKGMLYGLTRAEVEARLPEIRSFSELGADFEKPLGTYSSGMRARLGYSVAVAARPDILIIDEGLAVGDSAFKQKCYRQLKDMGATSGIILITHSVNRLRQVANRIAIMEHGRLVKQTTNVSDAIMNYLGKDSNTEEPAAPALSAFTQHRVERKISHSAKFLALQIPQTWHMYDRFFKFIWPSEKTARLDISRSGAIQLNRRPLGNNEIDRQTEYLHGFLSASDCHEFLLSEQPAKLITWVRDPVDRVLTKFEVQKRNLRKKLKVVGGMPGKLSAIRKDLLEFARAENNRNQMSAWLPVDSLPDFYFIGVEEHFEEDMTDLIRMLGMAEVPKGLKPPKRDRHDVSLEIREEILRLNEKDSDLYQKVLALRKSRRN